MCTLIALWQCHPVAPLVLALNRDEFLDRPTRGLHLWDEAEPARQIVAGRDLRAGGTWFGVSRCLVAGLTNQSRGRDWTAPAAGEERSRGELVVRALGRSDVEGVGAELAALPAAAYGPFHLLASDGRRMGWWTNRRGRLEAVPVAPGIHVLGNHGLDDPQDPVVVELQRALEGVEELPPRDLYPFLRSLLAETGPGWPCVHLGAYGTRSSAVLSWGGTDPVLLATDGPPCTAPWRDLSRLLAELDLPRETRP